MSLGFMFEYWTPEGLMTIIPVERSTALAFPHVRTTRPSRTKLIFASHTCSFSCCSIRWSLSRAVSDFDEFLHNRMEVPVPFLGAKSIMKDFVEWIEFLVDSVLAGIWLEGPLLQSRHGFLGIRKTAVAASRHGTGDCGTQRACMTGSAHHHGSAGDIG